VMPTLLGLMGLKAPSRVTGKNFWPLVTGDTRNIHDYVVQTYGWVGVVRNHEWAYSEIWKPEASQTEFCKYPGASPMTYQPQLYNLDSDPKELTDVAYKHPDVARQMSAKLKEYIASGEGLTYGSFNGKPALDTEEGLYAK